MLISSQTSLQRAYMLSYVAQVGKTSLILSLVSEEFPEEVTDAILSLHGMCLLFVFIF